MSGTRPVALYAAKVPAADGMLVPAVPGAAAMCRITMASIDPDAAPELGDDANSNMPLRSTLKVIRAPADLDIDGEGDSDEDSDDSDEDSSEDESNGGPSDPAKLKKAKEAAALKALEEEGEDDVEGGENIKAAISKLIKGKDKALDDDDDEGSENSDSDELEEVVVCTLDPEKNYQQPLDIVIGMDERVFFKVNGTNTIYLTGNYVIPLDEGGPTDDESESEEGDYDMPPGEDELDELDLMDEDDESDALDDVDNPRITEVDSDEETSAKAKAKASKKAAKGKNKRPAGDSDEEMSLDNIMGKVMKPADQPMTNGEQKLSKKQQKKLKKNNGEAAEVKAAGTTKETEQKSAKDSPSAKSDKKVQFAKDLEQGPTGSTHQKDAPTGTLGVKEVQGVKIDDKKLGKGRQAKQGDRVGMRYIGKLDDGKVFDANKKGKPLSFKVGSGEVIKGWDIGVPGMSAGGERRIVVPAHHAYGKKQLPGIPANSKLTFDIKLLEIK